MSVIKQIIDVIEDTIKTYMPSQHKGECVEPYAVVKLDGVTSLYNISSERPLYTIMIYVPYNQYSKLEEYSIKIKQEMKKLFPLVMYIGNETPSYYDDAVKGHMISFQYQGIRKIENY